MRHRIHRTPHSISFRSRRCRRRPPCCLLCGMAYHRYRAALGAPPIEEGTDGD